LSRRGRKLLWGLIVTGVVARLAVAFKTYGLTYDMNSAEQVRDVLHGDALHLYSLVNGHPNFRWPYLPGFLPWIQASGWLESHVGLPFHGWVQVLPIAADAAIAWLVQYYLGLRGAAERARLAAAALVALGPSFAVISGYHGQIDQVAILPAVAALVVWERLAPGSRRGLVAGALIGVAISLKTVPVLMLAVLLPWAGSRREAGALVLAAVAIPLAALAPFLIADGHAVTSTLREHVALPGFGGLSLLVQPEFAKVWLVAGDVPMNGLNRALLEHEHTVVAALLLPFVALTVWRRPHPAFAAAFLWLALELLTVGWAFQYAVWALPFALMCGWIWQVAAVQGALLIPTALTYHHGMIGSPHLLYIPIMIATWIVLTGALLVLAWRLAGPRSAPVPALDQV
jgi:hypothetical protein